MKKLITISLIITSLLLSSCTIDWNNEKDKKIAELEKKVQKLEEDNNLFNKKQKCLGYKSDIEKDLKEKEIKDGKGKYTLEQIFYSSKNNGCYFTYNVKLGNFNNKFLYEYGNHSWYSEFISMCEYNNCLDLNKKIEELKK